ncbi:hypothetical protein [Spiroplasma sp. BIUS-1]|uniref:hypothetical protein n=1 Tax=Spiroplasma sp. BIUS-1 TaxID=216964 RepID=UPI0013983B91|nr:hypothetical protein [Spiroplasma sp. BIUS-1]QHX36768.1 hypothetical protein SBIUS_v1c05150 [Spiroplasma sp. BIUS-1]
MVEVCFFCTKPFKEDDQVFTPNIYSGGGKCHVTCYRQKRKKGIKIAIIILVVGLILTAIMLSVVLTI